jgi:uncharacterized membrane protein
MRLRRHGRFLLALAAGLAAGLAALRLGPALRFLLGFDVFFAVYLALTGLVAARSTAAELRRSAAEEDEGLALILPVIAAIILLSLVVIFLLLRQPEGGLRAALAVASVPLGWLVLHTLTAFHYANLYYAPRAEGGAGGLGFPRTPEPGPWDFLYFAFVIGIAAQVSDVTVRSTPMRKAVLAHSVASVFYNAVILALVVNAVLTYAG